MPTLDSEAPIVTDEVKKGRDFSVVIVLVIVILIVILGGGIVLYDRFVPDRSARQVDEIRPLPGSSGPASEEDIRSNSLEELSRSSSLKDAINNLVIDSALIVEIKNDPRYLMTEELAGTDIAENTSSFASTIATQAEEDAKEAYKQFLLASSEEYYSEIVPDMQLATKHLLEQLLYMARVSKSSSVSPTSKVLWRTAIQEGEKDVRELSELAIDQKEELKIFLDDFFNRDEFKDS